jgi:hypothetical protein
MALSSWLTRLSLRALRARLVLWAKILSGGLGKAGLVTPAFSVLARRFGRPSSRELRVLVLTRRGAR